MACSLSHTIDEIQSLVQKLIDEDIVRQKAITELAVQFDNANIAKDNLSKAYEKCNDIPQESRALIDTYGPGQQMSPVEYHIILEYRFMISLFLVDAIYPVCGKTCLDSFEEHAVHYKELSGIKYRHVNMDNYTNDFKLDLSSFEQFQKFVNMYEQFQIFLDMVDLLKNFLAIKPHAMSTLSNKSLASFFKCILDSGATHHMSHLLASFISLNLNSSKSIVAANGDFMPLAGIGSFDTPSIALSDVYYIPNLTMNLASISEICDSLCDVNFFDSNCSIYDQKTHKVVGTGHRKRDLYVLDHFRDIQDTASISVDLSSFWLNRSSSAFYLWHSRLGHVFGSRLCFLASTRALEKLDTHDISDCSGCKLAKFSTLPFSNSVLGIEKRLGHYQIY
ncbi:gag-pol polyprotein [Tanacetum coccineum]